MGCLKYFQIFNENDFDIIYAKSLNRYGHDSTVSMVAYATQ